MDSGRNGNNIRKWDITGVGLSRSPDCGSHAGLQVNPEGMHFPEMGSILFQPFVITHSFSNLQESGFPYHLIEAVLLKFPPDHRKNQWALISPHPSQPIFAFNSVIFLLSGTLSSPTHSDSIPVLPSLVHFPLTENIWM